MATTSTRRAPFRAPAFALALPILLAGCPASAPVASAATRVSATAEAPDGTPARVLFPENHTGSVTSAAFSADGEWLATSSTADDTVRIWHVPTRSVVTTLDFAAEDAPALLAWSHDAERLALGWRSGSVALHARGGEKLAESDAAVRAIHWMFALRLDRDGTLVGEGPTASCRLGPGLAAESVRCGGSVPTEWPTESEVVRDGIIADLRLVPERMAYELVAGPLSAGPTERLADGIPMGGLLAPGPRGVAVTGIPAPIVGASGARPRTLAAPPGESRAAVWSGDDLLVLRCDEPLETAYLDRYPRGRGAPESRALDRRGNLCFGERAWLSPDGRTLAVDTGTLELVDVEAGRVETPGPDPAVATLSPAGDQLYVRAAVNPGGPVRVFSAHAAGPAPLGEQLAGAELVHEAATLDGRVIAGGSFDGVRAYDTVTARQVGRLESASRVRALAASASALAVLREDATLALWQPGEEGEPRSFPVGEKPERVAVTADGRYAAVAGRGGVGLWDLADGHRAAWLPQERGVQALAFSRDGSTLLVAPSPRRDVYLAPDAGGARGSWRRAPAAVERFRVPAGAPAGALPPVTGGASHAVACPDGFVVAGNDGRLRRHDAAGAERWSVPAPALRALSADAACRRVAASARTGLVLLLDGADGAERGRLAVRGRAWLVATPDGRHDGDESGLALGHAARARPASLRTSAPQRVPGLAAALLGGAPAPERTAAPEVVAQIGDSSVEHLALSADGRTLVLGAGVTDSAVARIWDLRAGKLVRSIRQRTSGLDVSPDGARVAISDGERTIVYDVRTGLAVGDVEGLGAVAFHPGGDLLAVETYRAIVLHDAATLRAVSKIPLEDQGARLIAFSPEGDVLAAAAAGGAIRWFEASTGRKLGEAHIPGGATVLRVSSRGRHLAATALFDSDTGTFPTYLLDGKTGARKAALVVRARPWEGADEEMRDLTDLAFSRDGSILVGAASAGPVVVWDAASGKELRRLEAAYAASRIAVSPEGRTLLAGAYGGAGRFDLDSGERLESFGRLFGGAFAANPARLELAVDVGAAWIWDAAHGTRLSGLASGGPWHRSRSRHVPDQALAQLAWSADGNALAIGTTHELVVRDRRTGATRLELRDGPDLAGFRHVALDRTGARVAFGTLRDVHVRDVARNRPLRRIPAEPDAASLHGLALSADGSLVATCTRHQGASVSVWDVATGARLWREPTAVAGSVVAFDPAGERLAMWQDGRVRIRDARTGRELVRLASGGTSTVALAWSPDGERLATGGRDGRLYVWDAATGHALEALDAHDAEVTHLAYTAAGRLLVSASADRTVRLRRTADGLPLVATLLVDGDDLVVVAADGKYLATRGALAAVGFRIDGRAYPVEQFDLPLNQPAAVLRALDAAAPELVAGLDAARERRLRRMGVDPAALRFDLALPEVELVEEPPAVTGEPALTLRVRARDPGGALARLNVHVDDVPLFGSRGRPLAGVTAEASVVVPLTPGAAKLQVSVANALGQASRYETRLVRSLLPPGPRTLHVVAVGTSRYRDARWNLAVAAKDAEDVGRHFAAAKGFAEVEVHALVDEQVTREAVLALRGALEASEPDDLVVLFFAGHGLLAPDGAFYFATHDLDFERPAERGLPFEAIEALVDGIPARQKLVLVDACHSGEAPEALRVAAATPAAGGRGFQAVKEEGAVDVRVEDVSAELFADLRRASGAVAISAASATQAALESVAVGNGYFTRALLEGLGGNADADRDGAVRVSELRAFVARRVSEMSAGKQTPTARRENLSRDFAVP